MKKAVVIILLCCAKIAAAQDPMLTHWWFNTTNNMYNGILTDVEAVYYTTQYVYVKSSGIPNYYLDGQTHNDGSDLHATWVLPRTPQASGNPAGVIGGQMGLMIDGSVFFHPGDAQSYNNAGVWNRLAYYFEGQDMDASNGHSTPDNMYHHHFDNIKLHTFDSSQHSPIVAYAWDGYPVYGPFGYKNTDGTGGISRMKTSYQVKAPTGRINGPGYTGQYLNGCFIEDWEYISGLGDLDEHNGRFCVTPEYPSGTYAYFTTVDENLDPIYPYFIGPTFYGVIATGNTGPGGGQNSIPSGATQYNPVTGVDEVGAIESDLQVFPIPVSTDLNVRAKDSKNYKVVLYNLSGQVIHTEQMTQNTKIDMSTLPHGVYFVQVADPEQNRGFIKRIIKQ